MSSESLVLDKVDLSNSAPNLTQAWAVCLVASLFFFFEFVQMNMFNALDPYLMTTFHISAKDLGSLSAYYFYANIIFLIPAGLVLDRFSTRRVVVIAMLACVLSTYGFSFMTSLWQGKLCRFITGMGGSFCLLSCVRLASRWFKPHQMALVVGVMVTVAMTGGMVAQTPLTLLVDHVGWRWTVAFDASMGLLFLGLIFCVVRDYPPSYKRQLQSDSALQHALGVKGVVCQALSNLQNWFGGLYTSLMNLPIFILGALWGSLYLVQIRGLSRPEASVVVSMLFFGTIIGSPLMGWLSDYWRTRRQPMLWGAVLAFAVVVCLVYVPHLSFVTLLILFFALGLITSTQIISYPMISESNPLAITGAAEGLASVLIMAGGLVQPLSAHLMEAHWAHRYIHHIAVYGAQDYRTAFVIMPIAFGLAFVMALCVRETGCESLVEEADDRQTVTDETMIADQVA